VLFNSLTFVIFLPLVFALHWGVRKSSPRPQNVVIIVASSIFYGWWDVRFLALIALNSAVDFGVGLALEAEERPRRRKQLILLSIAFNIGVLAFFKYFNFFIESFAALVESVGLRANLPSLQVILPVGISFYTFQTLSYTIDVYRRQMTATRDPFAFFAFVSFFPQLVAGPIERASHLLPQFYRSRVFETRLANEGLRQMLWGMAKKVVVADNIAPHVNAIFNNYGSLDGVVLAWGAVLFSIQIYCDFSGYSDIAIGTAKLFGIDLSANFKFPYFSSNIVEFWRRWHISLSSWFRDYVYIPLGGSLVSRFVTLRNVLITFTVSGLWHGANWTFVVWGFLHGVYYLAWSLVRPLRVETAELRERRFLPTPVELIGIVITFTLVTLSWVFFRSASLEDAGRYLLRGVTHPLEPIDGRYGWDIVYVLPMLAVEWTQRHLRHGLDVERLSLTIRWCAYMATALAILEFGNFGETAFIYFQF